jgi:RimJ/RimL family protein N-acetyltransferase
MDTSNLILETKNLCLKSITLDYQDEIFKEFTPEITVFMFPKPAEKIDETIAFIESSIQDNKTGKNWQVVILKKDNSEFLGCAGLHHIDVKTPELGVWIKKSAHGHSYGKEAIVALKEWADQNLDYDYLLYPVADKNIASRKIPKSLGGIITNESDKVGMGGNKFHALEYRIYSKYK